MFSIIIAILAVLHGVVSQHVEYKNIYKFSYDYADLYDDNDEEHIGSPETLTTNYNESNSYLRVRRFGETSKGVHLNPQEIQDIKGAVKTLFLNRNLEDTLLDYGNLTTNKILIGPRRSNFDDSDPYAVMENDYEDGPQFTSYFMGITRPKSPTILLPPNVLAQFSYPTRSSSEFTTEYSFRVGAHSISSSKISPVESSAFLPRLYPARTSSNFPMGPKYPSLTSKEIPYPTLSSYKFSWNTAYPTKYSILSPKVSSAADPSSSHQPKSVIPTRSSSNIPKKSSYNSLLTSDILTGVTLFDKSSSKVPSGLRNFTKSSLNTFTRETHPRSRSKGPMRVTYQTQTTSKLLRLPLLEEQLNIIMKTAEDTDLAITDYTTAPYYTPENSALRGVTKPQKIPDIVPLREPKFDINALVDIISNLTYDYDMNLAEEFNKTLLKYNIPTCPSPTTLTTQPTTMEEPPEFNPNTTVIAKCFVCGITQSRIPTDGYCGDAFANDFMPLIPTDPRAKRRLIKYRKYCRYLDIPNYFYDPSMSSSIYGRWSGGCAVRWAELTNFYTQRTCRQRLEPIRGRHFASKRMAKLEYALKDVENGCIASPMATLLPLSRGISLYSRFHACVCTGHWCNKAVDNQQWMTYNLITCIIAYYSCFGLM